MSKTLLQINVTANWGSHGRIAEDIGHLAIQDGWDSYIAYGRGNPTSESNLIRIGSRLDMFEHGLETRLFDNHGLASRQATKTFCKQLLNLNPTIVHLHNIHGYFLNYPQLFDTLKEWGGPVVWTLHDCWPMTGHCSHFMFVGCERWKEQCYKCELKGAYPASKFLDRSTQNFELKKKFFTQLGDKLTLVPVSKCVECYYRQSFFKDLNIRQIYNGVDVGTFKPYTASNRYGKYILGVASVWNDSKGLSEFHKLRSILPKEINIVMVGLTERQISHLPQGITGISRTDNVQQLAELYSSAIAFVNPTFEDNFPTTNIEALSCGTPVITYQTGGSPEAIDDMTGIVVAQGDIKGINSAIMTICNSSNKYSSDLCRSRALKLYRKEDRYAEYFRLYNELLGTI